MEKLSGIITGVDPQAKIYCSPLEEWDPCMPSLLILTLLIPPPPSYTLLTPTPPPNPNLNVSTKAEDLYKTTQENADYCVSVSVSYFYTTNHPKPGGLKQQPAIFLYIYWAWVDVGWSQLVVPLCIFLILFMESKGIFFLRWRERFRKTLLQTGLSIPLHSTSQSKSLDQTHG